MSCTRVARALVLESKADTNHMSASIKPAEAKVALVRHEEPCLPVKRPLVTVARMTRLKRCGATMEGRA